MSGEIPEPNLTLAYRLEAEIGELLDLGETHAGRRRIAHLTAAASAVPGSRESWSRARAPTGS